MTLRVLLAALGMSLLWPSQPQPRPRDPHRLTEVLGVRDDELGAASCHTFTTGLGRHPLISCSPNERELPRLAALGEFWSLTTDTSGAFYAGNRDWRPAPAAAARVRDSVARSLDRRPFRHLACPDSTHPTAGGRSYLSVWQGPSFRVLLFHVRPAGDSLVQVGLQVFADTAARCLASP